MRIQTWRDPYDAGFSTIRPKEIEIKPGVTVLVGCNGAGKSTLLKNIAQHCKSNKIPYNLYDNLKDGGSNSISEMFFNENISEGVFLLTASEGESIKANLGRNSTLYKDFFKLGYINNSSHRISMLFEENKEEKLEELKNTKDRVLLFDAVDSGLSVDSIIEVKSMFDTIIKDSPNYNINIYIIIAANEYELCRNSDCFDVNSGKYLRFTDYEDYRSFIIKSRIKKEKRIEKQKVWRETQHKKELNNYIKVKTKYIEKRNKYLSEVKNINNLSLREKHNLDQIREPLTEFERNCKYITDEEFDELKKDI